MYQNVLHALHLDASLQLGMCCWKSGGGLEWRPWHHVHQFPEFPGSSGGYKLLHMYQKKEFCEVAQTERTNSVWSDKLGADNPLPLYRWNLHLIWNRGPWIVKVGRKYVANSQFPNTSNLLGYILKVNPAINSASLWCWNEHLLHCMFIYYGNQSSIRHHPATLPVAGQQHNWDCTWRVPNKSLGRAQDILTTHHHS